MQVEHGDGSDASNKNRRTTSNTSRCNEGDGAVVATEHTITFRMLEYVDLLVRCEKNAEGCFAARKKLKFVFEVTMRMYVCAHALDASSCVYVCLMQRIKSLLVVFPLCLRCMM
jgi:hypothetical protein